MGSQKTCSSPVFCGIQRLHVPACFALDPIGCSQPCKSRYHLLSFYGCLSKTKSQNLCVVSELGKGFLRLSSHAVGWR